MPARFFTGFLTWPCAVSGLADIAPAADPFDDVDIPYAWRAVFGVDHHHLPRLDEGEAVPVRDFEGDAVRRQDAVDVQRVVLLRAIDKSAHITAPRFGEMGGSTPREHINTNRASCEMSMSNLIP